MKRESPYKQVNMQSRFKIIIIPFIALLFGLLGATSVQAAVLQVSTSPDRSNPSSLSNQTLSGNQYIFTDSGPANFYLDGQFRRTENYAPYDLAATASNGTANPLNVNTLSLGQHTVSAVIGGQTIQGTFQIGSLPPPPPPSGSSPTFDPRALFNQPVPASMRTNTNAQMGTNAVAGIRGDSPPLYIAPPGTPRRTAILGSRTTTFPIPSNITFGNGTDYPTIVRDPSTLDELRCWRGTFDGTTLRCQGGGLFFYNGDGRILNPDGSPSLGQAHFGGGAGNGLTYSAGMFTMQDFLNGGPHHAIRVASGCVSSTVWPPARKSDQADPGCPPMGSMALIPPDYPCQNLTSGTSDPDDTVYIRQLCVAGQVYGFMRSDGTGDNTTVIYHEGEATAHWLGPLTGCNSSLGCIVRRLPWSIMTLSARPPSFTAWQL